jgi:hypothetical protein
MKNKKIVLEETGLSISAGKEFVFSFIDSQIDNYKLNQLSSWEKNHKHSLGFDKIKEFDTIKKGLMDFFEELNPDSDELSLVVNIDIQTEKK